MSSPNLDRSITRVIDDRLAQLKEQGYAVLSQLPEGTEEERLLEGTKVALMVWMTRRAEGALVVVVQIHRRSAFPGLVGLANSDGFMTWPDGRTRSLTSDELLEYM